MFLRKNLREGELVVDVGAHVGHISLLLADVVKPRNVVAFEPSLVSYHRLQENWQLNGWSLSGLCQAAVGAKKGVVYIRRFDKPVPTNAVVKDAGVEGFVQVPVVALDDIPELWREQSIGLIKIDVEGYEDEVFRGSTRLLSEKRPRMIMFESLTGELDVKLGRHLQNSRYKVFQLDSDGCPDFSNFGAQNLFAVPVERVGPDFRSPTKGTLTSKG